LAADLPAPVAPYAPPPPPRPYNWTSVYIGGNAGYGFATASETASLFGFSVTASEDLTGFVGGGQVGANFQSGPVVFGVEADLDATNQTHNATFGFATASDKITWVGTVRGRIGGAWDRVLVYGTAGWGEGKFTSDVTVPGFGTFSGSRTHGAWTAGLGVEVGITDYLSGRIEYLYLDTGNLNLLTFGALNVTGRVQDNLIRAGLNLRLPL
jgi:outer membrane immunogenic protein